MIEAVFILTFMLSIMWALNVIFDIPLSMLLLVEGVIFGVLVAVFAVGCLSAFVLMLLWNHVLTAIVPVACIGFWKAYGLLIMAYILFGKVNIDLGKKKK